MIPILIFLGVAVVLLSTARKWLPGRQLLVLSVAPIFLMLAFRENFGNDYSAYRDMFNDFSKMSDPFDSSSNRHVEAGWVFLNLLFSDFGFKFMVAVLTMFSFYAVTTFIGRYSPPKYYWLSIALFVLVPTNFLIQLSAQRQALAIMVFLIAIQYISDRKMLMYAALVFLAYYFHASAIALLPLYFLSRIDFNIPKYFIFVAVALYAAMFMMLSIDSISEIMLLLSIWGDQLNFDKYAVYEADGGGTLGSGFGAMFYGTIMVMLFYFFPKQDKQVKPLFLMSILGIFMIPLIGVLGAFERFSAYFTVTLIVTIPILAGQLKNRVIRIPFVFINFLYPLYGFLNFFQNPTYKDFYKSIF